MSWENKYFKNNVVFGLGLLESLNPIQHVTGPGLVANLYMNPPGHQAIKVKFKDGTVFYLDSAWVGGCSDPMMFHIFGEEDIPWYYRKVSEKAIGNLVGVKPIK